MTMMRRGPMKRLRPRTANVLMQLGLTATTTTSTSAWRFSSAQPTLLDALNGSICCHHEARRCQ
jgi:hypothetical protein